MTHIKISILYLSACIATAATAAALTAIYTNIQTAVALSPAYLLLSMAYCALIVAYSNKAPE